MHGGTEPAPSPACQSESCHLRPNERSRKSGIDFGTSRPGNPTPRQNRAVSPAANTDHIRRKGKALRSRTVRTRPAQASEPQPQQQGAERLRSAIRRMYKRAGADEGIVPLSYRRRSTPALCHSQNERSRPRKRRNNVPNSSERNARARQFAVCTNVPVLMKESYLCHTEGGVRPRSAIRRTSGRVRASVGTTSPTAVNGTPVLGNFQSARLFWRRTYSTARFASALPAAKGRTNTPSSSFWKARFINLFAGKSPPLPFIRRYTIPVVNAA